ncbi:MAG: NUDIX hydrolase [Planctomycetes bacterium]|nr:NUDIX hydrolase [Planctomycetota bacterium]MBI3847712.1 NUDIX hydrolase [Planctomycetota bacterium]
MHVNRAMLADVERRFGKPIERSFGVDYTEKEFAFLVRSTHGGRRLHDVTLFILWRGRIGTIRKQAYPPGLFRPPSGGVERGESFVDGAVREAFEETGLRVRLERYVMRAHVRFSFERQHVDWTSHVFTARYLSGLPQPRDTKEIAEFRWMTTDQLRAHGDVLRGAPMRGLHYRAALNDAVLDALAALRGPR